MSCRLLILFFCLFTRACFADEPDFDFKSVDAQKALRSYNTRVKKNQDELNKAINQLKEKNASDAKKNLKSLIESLQKSLKKTMRAGDLNEANRLNDAITSLQKGDVPPGDAIDPNNIKAILLSSVIGIWVSSDGEDFYIIRPNGSAIRGSVNTWGKWEAKDIIKAAGNHDEFTIKWASRSTSRSSKKTTTQTSTLKVGKIRGERFITVGKSQFLPDKYFVVRDDL